MRAGEFCAGYGGLMMAIEEVFNAEPAWVSEFDAAPSKILAYHYPTVPNLGDMTKVDWSTVELVEVMGGGTPCQDLSHAGKRKGMTEGTRSNLWVHMREAIAIQRPLYVVWENVRGAYSADADSDLEFCPGCMGEAGDKQSVLRALGRVLGDLSDLGYDVQWRGLRASDVGAPHARFRVFVLARRRDALPDSRGIGGDQTVEHDGGSPTIGNRAGVPDESSSDAHGVGPIGEPSADGNSPGRRWNAAQSSGPGVDKERERPRASGGSSGPTTHPEGIGWGEGWAESARELGRLAATGNSASASDTDGGDDDGRLGDAQRLEEQREALAGRGEGSGDSTYTEGDEGRELNGDGGSAGNTPYDDCHGSTDSGETSGRGRVNWGDYDPAIRRWEASIGRRAPRPTEPSDVWLKMIAKRKAGLDKRPVGMRGSIAKSERLSPRFTEWMMGLPDGWVTDPAIGISRNEQLKACGNGVVPQQAIAALRDMLEAFRSEGIAA